MPCANGVCSERVAQPQLYAVLGLAVAPLARCAVPERFVTLGRQHGLPKLPELEIILARSARSNRPPCDYLAEQILSELRD